MNLLEGKRALVGGASQGIGRACAQALARQGATVTAVARDEVALKEVTASLDAGSGQSHGIVVADFSDLDKLATTFTQHVEASEPYHILVNNTGGPPSGPLMDATTEQLIDGISKHVMAYQILVKLLVPGMRKQRYGRVINIISTSVVAPIQGLGVSNTTRGAVANWGRTLAGELGPDGITVNNVLPGFTNTDRLTSLLEKKAKRLGTTLNEVVDKSKESIPLHRFATPDEIGSVVGFLASPEASYVSGVNLPVDGGRTAVQ